MTENDLSYKIRGAIYKIYNALGPGLLESAYEAALAYELEKEGLNIHRQVKLPFQYEAIKI
jgi:GxxExxY protein